MLVQISEIKVNPGRREADPEGVQELVDSISKVGLINPIMVDQEHTLIAGLHRLEAAKLLGEGEFDQVDRVLYDLKHNPQSRRIITNIYVHADLHEMNLYPCAYSVTFNVADGKLNAILNQRSNDMAVANNWNVTQYAVLVHMLAQVRGLEVGELVHVIADAHVYDRHIPQVEQMLKGTPHPAPKFVINKDVTDFYKFTVDDFAIVDYEHEPFNEKFEVAI